MKKNNLFLILMILTGCTLVSTANATAGLNHVREIYFKGKVAERMAADRGGESSPISAKEKAEKPTNLLRRLLDRLKKSANEPSVTGDQPNAGPFGYVPMQSRI